MSHSIVSFMISVRYCSSLACLIILFRIHTGSEFWRYWIKTVVPAQVSVAILSLSHLFINVYALIGYYSTRHIIVFTCRIRSLYSWSSLSWGIRGALIFKILTVMDALCLLMGSICLIFHNMINWSKLFLKVNRTYATRSSRQWINNSIIIITILSYLYNSSPSPRLVLSRLLKILFSY